MELLSVFLLMERFLFDGHENWRNGAKKSYILVVNTFHGTDVCMHVYVYIHANPR